ncbi:MAG TPA: HAD family phosphatase [Terriglobales bacterium]|jgi:putative hydrolase of the HAD superfamily
MNEPITAAEKIKIRAVVFDYGMVLSLEQPSSALEEMAAICGVPLDVFRKAYWEYRLAYDCDLNGTEYWKKTMALVGVELTAAQIAKLVLVDGGGWSHLNPVSVNWVRQLRSAGLQLAVLSNMPSEVKEYLVGHLEIFSYFEHLIFSCDVRQVKPEPGIYQHCIDVLQLSPHEILFLDDKQENVDGATDFGIHALVVDSIENTIARVRDQFDLPVPASFELSTSGLAK